MPPSTRLSCMEASLGGTAEACHPCCQPEGHRGFCRLPVADRRFGRPDRIEQHRVGGQDSMAGQCRRKLCSLRCSRAWHGSGDERYRASWRGHSRRTSFLHRLLPSVDPLSALMRKRVIYVMTHDLSVWQMARHTSRSSICGTRVIPNLLVFRLGDAVETAGQCALAAEESPRSSSEPPGLEQFRLGDLSENMSARRLHRRRRSRRTAGHRWRAPGSRHCHLSPRDAGRRRHCRNSCLGSLHGAILQQDAAWQKKVLGTAPDCHSGLPCASLGTGSLARMTFCRHG